jgi:hypothetical protein
MRGRADFVVQRHSNALQLRDGCTMFRSMPYQIGDAVTASGAMGMRIPVSYEIRAV